MYKITSKIKFIGLILSLICALLIGITIVLNDETKDNDYVVNIAGKQRMLSQRMAKELFLNLSNNRADFAAFWDAKRLFDDNLHSLRYANISAHIAPPPTEEIAAKLDRVKEQSIVFYTLATKMMASKDTMQPIDKNLIADVYVQNEKLLFLMDDTVISYTQTYAAKKHSMEIIQYIGGAVLFVAILVSIFLTKKIETEFEVFLQTTRAVAAAPYSRDDTIKQTMPTDEKRHELAQAQGDLEYFIHTVGAVVTRAQKSLEESKNAISELENAARTVETRFFETVKDTETRKDIETYLDKSDDLIISSIEEIDNTKELLRRFEETLTKLDKKDRGSTNNG